MIKFIYENLEFEALERLKGKESDFWNITKKIINENLTPPNWNYKEFYKTANKHGAGTFDLFLMNNKIVIPSNYILWVYFK
jgi:hypothetical protein